MRRLKSAFLRLLRAVSLIAFAIALTTALVRNAPGYLSDSGEMDASHASSTRVQLQSLAQRDASTKRVLLRLIRGIGHGDFGESRQFGVPVQELLRPRTASTGRLFASGITLGWLGALCAACGLAWSRHRVSNFLAVSISAALIAVPVGALAMICLALNHGGPILILALVIGVRDFRLLHRLLLQVLDAPCIEHAHALGLRPLVILSLHVYALLRQTLPQLLIASVVVALGAMLPLEVIFDLPGIGQLAWNAAMNRDIPVLQAVTAMVAGCVALGGLIPSNTPQGEVQTCAP